MTKIVPKTEEFRRKKARATAEWRRGLTVDKREEYRQRKNQIMRNTRRDRPEIAMFRNAQRRAKKFGLDFNIDLSDIVIPRYCPVLGIELKTSETGKSGPNSPSLDRIRPALGYIKGNVEVISWRANSIKSDATPEELLALAKFYSRRSNTG